MASSLGSSCPSYGVDNVMRDLITDEVVYLGSFGTLASVSLGSINDILGICAGVLTCVYLLIKIVKTKNEHK